MKTISKLFSISLAMLVMSLPQVAFSDDNGNSDAAYDCNKDGYLSLVGANGQTFSNVGDCFNFADEGGAFATGIIIPANNIATLTPTFFACDTLTWGYQLNFGANVDKANFSPFRCPLTGSEPTVHIGPFGTATLLRIYLTETSPCSATYYSDGGGNANHALVTPTPLPETIIDNYEVDIMDTGVCGYADSTRLPLGPGDGNLNVIVDINPAT